jgi:hypothetical protein
MNLVRCGEERIRSAEEFQERVLGGACVRLANSACCSSRTSEAAAKAAHEPRMVLCRTLACLTPLESEGGINEAEAASKAFLCQACPEGSICSHSSAVR